MEARTLTGGDLDVFIEIEVPRTQTWLYDTIQAFVNDEGGVFVGSATSDTGSAFMVRVAPGDMGKVIGKNGQMARNLRSMLLARGRKLGVLYTLEIEEGATEQAAPVLMARAS